jgi:hypothetical protein
MQPPPTPVTGVGSTARALVSIFSLGVIFVGADAENAEDCGMQRIARVARACVRACVRAWMDGQNRWVE